MGFVSLQRSGVRRSTCRGFAEPATFRPQGLVTLSAAYSLRARAGLVSYRRRSWDSPFGAFSSREVSACLHVEAPTCRFSCRCYRRRRQRAGPAGRGFWALALARVPGDRRGVSAPSAGCSRGLCPSRVFRQKPSPGSLPLSSLALCGHTRKCDRRRPRVSIGSCLVSPAHCGKPHGWAKQPS